jgi:hypothetical protein
MSNLYFVLYGAVFLLVLLLVIKQSGRTPFPPGPRPLPFVGNAFDMDISKPWLTYANWKERYGK